MKALVQLIMSLVFITSCSTRIGVRTPSTQFISPEAIGDTLKGEIDTFIGRGAKANVSFDGDRTDNPLNVSDDDSDGSFSGSLGLGATIGALPKLDFIVVKPVNKHPALFGLKYQVLGNSRIAAKKGNHSVAVAGFLGGNKRDDLNDDGFELTPMNDEVDITLESFATRATIVYGYRAQQNALFYTGVNYSTLKFSGRLESNNLALDGEKLSYSSSAVGANIGIMIELKNILTFKIEATHQKVDWQRTDAKSFNTLALGTGWRWF